MRTNLKMISEIPTGFPFHYYGRPDRIFIKERKGHAVAPDNGVVRVSESTLVVLVTKERQNDRSKR